LATADLPGQQLKRGGQDHQQHPRQAGIQANGKLADAGYVTVATGLDYLEMAPTSGRTPEPRRNVLTANRCAHHVGGGLICHA
jgi:hypothetical protein